MRLLPASKYAKTLNYATQNKVANENIYPFYCSYKVTHHCNLRCSFCNVWMEDTPDLDLEGVKKVLDNIADSSIIVLSLEGGDPLVRKDIDEVLEYAHKLPFYLFFTTNGHLLDKRPMDELGKNVDYIHISIDEGHDNMDFFERLSEFQSYGPEICIQSVVTKDTLDDIEDKVKRVYDAGARTVIMPACHLDNTDDFYPDPAKFRTEINRLKKLYPHTITTPSGFLDNINKPHGCSPSSIIIDSDGGLFYPCRTIGEHQYNFTEGRFMDFLKTPEAAESRRKMAECDRQCGWYQYFATDVFADVGTILSSLDPYLFRQPNAKTKE